MSSFHFSSCKCAFSSGVSRIIKFSDFVFWMTALATIARTSVNQTVMVILFTDKPEMVTLATNATENKDCSDLWVNFTCISSEANPPVYNYLLSGDEDGLSLISKSGTWIKKISRGGKVVYNCLAYQLVGNVTSTNNITLTVNGKFQ